MADIADLDYKPDESEESDDTLSDNSKSSATIIEESETRADRKNRKRLIPIMYQCSLCSHQTSLRNKLKLHFYSCIRASKAMRERPRNVITSGVKFKCEYCSFIVTKSEDLVKHKESHRALIDSGPIECRYCSFKFFTPDEYSTHLYQNLHFRDQADQFDNNCDPSSKLCIDNQETVSEEHDGDKQTPTQNVQHNDNQSCVSKNYYGQGKINGLYSCPCNKFQTKYRYSYVRHINIKHPAQDKVKIETRPQKENLLVCSRCSYNTNSQLQLSLHLAIDHTKDGHTFVCPKLRCDFSTEQKEQLKLHLTDIHELRNCNSANSLFKCPTCLHIARNGVLLKAHEILAHTLSSESPYACPWPKCLVELKSKPIFKQHLKGIHGLNINNCRSASGDVDNEPLISCDVCNHKSRTDIQMKIHKMFQHHTKDQTAFPCPISECSYNSVYKHHIKEHLETIHKFRQEHFGDYGDPNAWEMEADISEHALQGLKEVSQEDYKYNKYKWRKSRKRRYDCNYCNYSSGYGINVRRHVERNHAINQCGVCQRSIRGKFQMFWHNYVIHRDTSQVRQWLVICALCGYEGLTKDGYHHGTTHKLPEVTFNAFRQSLPAGTITFRYTVNVERGFDSQAGSLKVSCNAEDLTDEIEGDDYTAPAVVKVLDWTMSDDENTEAKPLRESDNEETITIQFKEDSDNEEGGNNDDGNIGYNNETDDLLLIKSEYITCKQCPYEARDLKSMKIHTQLVHAHWVITSSGEYQCPTEDCPFTSKYKANFKRHLVKKHNIKIGRYYRSDDSSSSNDSVSDMREIDGKIQEPELQSEQMWEEGPDNEADSCMEKRATPFGRTKNNLNFCKVKYLCPKQRCQFCTDNRSTLKKHFISYHKIKEINRTIISAKTFACSKCDFQAKKSDEIRVHFKSCRVGKAKLPGYKLKCIVCPYELRTKKDAYRHGWQHYRENLVPIVTFNKFIKNHPRGFLKFRYSTKFERRCNKCRFIGSTEFDLYKHRVRYHKGDLKTTDRRKAKEMVQRQMVLRRKQTRELINQKRRRQRKQTRTLRNVKESAISINTLQQREEVKMCNFNAEESPGYTQKLIIQIDNETQENRNNTMDVKIPEDNSDRQEKQTESYSLEELQRIIGITLKTESDSKIATIDTDWIAALEDEVLNDEENEIIRIEFTGDSDEEDDGTDAVLSPTDDAPLETGMLRVKCKNEGCVYTCRDLKDIQKHAKSCKKSYRKCDERCELCQAVFSDKKSLKNHIKNDHVQHSLSKSKNKVLKNDISYLCSMCGAALSYRPSLINHTYVHAKADNNFNLKVTFTQYKGDEIVDTILMKADPNYKPRESSNVPLHRILKEKCSRPPILEYDPTLPVYSCTECNFKTNSESALTQHKNLHWTAEKEKAFKERKWFTCGVCYYHCLDAAAFKKHGEKHRDRPSARIGVKKASKDSWLF